VKKTFAILFLVFNVILVQAQNDSIAAYRISSVVVSVTGGVAIPVGTFANFETDPDSYTDYIAGHSLEGLDAAFRLDYFIFKNFGISLRLSTSKAKAAEPDSASLFYDPCPWCHGMGGGTRLISYQYETGEWKTMTAIAGLAARLQDENVAFTFRISGGLMQITSPNTEMQMEKYFWQIGYPITYYSMTKKQPSVTTNAFVAGVGFDAGFSLGKRLALLFAFDFLKTRATFNGEYEFGSSKESYHIGKNISLFCVNAGLSYSFKSIP
jgi:hypothetical protein